MPTWAFAKLQTARHSRYSRHPFHAGPHFGASLVRSCYGLLGCSSPWTDQTRTLPASGDFYFQAFDELVTLLIAGYNYGSHWTPLPAGLSPAGITASFAALQPRGAHTEWKLLFLCNLFPLHAAYGAFLVKHPVILTDIHHFKLLSMKFVSWLFKGLGAERGIFK